MRLTVDFATLCSVRFGSAGGDFSAEDSVPLRRLLGVLLMLAAVVVSPVRPVWGGPLANQVAVQDEAAERERVDEAIVRALMLLSQEQQPSGAWIANNIGESTAVTSLAVMAFLAAGHVPGEGPYGERLNKGIRWVIDQQQPNGMIVHRAGHGPMYSHGISTLMLAEVLGMVDEPLAGPCRRALERAIRLILSAQNIAKPIQHSGGWRYEPTSQESDLSVSAWQVLALRAAKNVGCDVPADNIDKAVDYIKRCSVRDGRQRGFAYQPGGSPTPTRSGTGILSLEICGKHREPETLAAADALLARPLRYADSYFFYGAYYCSVGMFKLGGDYWKETQREIGGILLAKQAANGGWTAPSGSEQRAGLVYSTSLAVLALAIDYRYLPIYQR